jgi:hypothetical protein
MQGSSENKRLDDDEAWLEVLAGRSVTDMDQASRQQAERVRASLIRRRSRHVTSAPSLDDASFERLLFRMKREGVDSGTGTQRVRQPSFVWGIAASVVLGVAVVFQVTDPTGDWDLLGGNKQRGSEVMRGTPDKATIRLVDDLQASQAEIVTLIKQAGAEPNVTVIKGTGDVVIQVEATQAVRDALAGDPLRIYPDIQDGKITVVLKPTKPKK